MMDAESDGVKKWGWYPLSERSVNDTSDEGEYNHFTILPFYEDDISATVIHHFTM